MKTNKLVVAMIAALISVNSFGQTVDEIVDKHVAAIGGMDKIRQLTTWLRNAPFLFKGWKFQVRLRSLLGRQCAANLP